MSLRNLRRFDVQARYAAVLGLLAVLPAGGALYLVGRNFHPGPGGILYRNEMFVLGLAVCIGLAVLIGLTAAALGFNSAGQRRNDFQGRSWLGFFIGGASVTAAVVAGIAFAVLRMPA
ncbi:MAG: hypothetical protein C4547_00590 [Phycisphaerales bacterium]|nr:MAG: hypothetical protein C4547_00590 [Phycisphaerales bacterium]